MGTLSKQKLLAIVLAAVIAVGAIVGVILLRDRLIPGWYQDGEDIYYLTFPFKRASGLTTVNGKDYLFSDYGNNALLYGWNKFDGERYYSDRNGVIVKGEYTVDGVRYNFDAKTGILYQNETRIVDGKLWFYGENGFRVFGIVEMDGQKFCFNETGNLKKGLQVIDGKTYYFDPEDENMVFGLKTVGGATYYFGDDGAAVVGEMVIDGVTYVFGEDGKKLH